MTEYLLIGIVSFAGAGLTLFSGFGLGTILVPVFGLFFPVHIAIGLTAIVHFLNNLFKLLLLGENADKAIIIRFGIPSVLAALAGAYFLNQLILEEPVVQYFLYGKMFSITPLKLVISIILLLFALFEIIPFFNNLHFSVNYLPLGGVLSGFFGGLSGHQGALRSAFLIKTGLSKESFIATGVVIACMIDVSRLTIYSSHLTNMESGSHYSLIVVATLSAFAGVYLGNKLLKKTTIKTLQYTVAIMLMLFAVLLGIGII